LRNEENSKWFKRKTRISKDGTKGARVSERSSDSVESLAWRRNQPDLACRQNTQDQTSVQEAGDIKERKETKKGEKSETGRAQG
jgi:hypothetical protein